MEILQHKLSIFQNLLHLVEFDNPLEKRTSPLKAVLSKVSVLMHW
jgi:hypothetical protein